MPKDWIRLHLPGSVLDSALQDDPDVTELTLTHPDITPESLRVITDLVRGVEPSRHHPELAR
ncbi:MAG TPA: hypothetical protein VKH37_10950, partial [Ferruginibacter sp.]|nr:hypothetical protein [Ferruginibacter sp.]